MKRRNLLAAVPLLAGAAAFAQDAGLDAGSPGFPDEEKLAKGKREVYDALGKVRLRNEDGPDVAPRVPPPSRKGGARK